MRCADRSKVIVTPVAVNVTFYLFVHGIFCCATCVYNLTYYGKLRCGHRRTTRGDTMLTAPSHRAWVSCGLQFARFPCRGSDGNRGDWLFASAGDAAVSDWSSAPPHGDTGEDASDAVILRYTARLMCLLAACGQQQVCARMGICSVCTARRQRIIRPRACVDTQSRVRHRLVLVCLLRMSLHEVI